MIKELINLLYLFFEKILNILVAISSIALIVIFFMYLFDYFVLFLGFITLIVFFIIGLYHLNKFGANIIKKITGG